MTLTELQNQVATLTFESPEEPDAHFTAVANRALNDLFCDLGVTTEIRLGRSAPRLESHTPRLDHRPGQTEKIELVGVAYSMRLYGKGSYTLTEGANSITRSFNTDGEYAVGRLSAHGELCFFGDTAFTVRNICVYAEIGDDSCEAIADMAEGIVRLDTRADFLALTEMPTDELGKPIKSCVVHGAILRVPRDFDGEIRAKYLRAPKRMFSEYPSTPIDIPKEGENLLPLLCAAYLLLESVPDMARHYLTEYKEQVEHIKRRRIIPTASYEVNNRWA